MTADRVLQILTQALFIAVFISVAIDARRAPTRANIDIVLLFANFSLAIAVEWVTKGLGIAQGRWSAALYSSLIMALPYMLLRLLADFSTVPQPIMRTAEAALLLSVVTLFLIDEQHRPSWLTLVYALYFVGLILYVSVAFVREARRSSGATQRRMEAVAFGSILLGLVIFVVVLQLLLPPLEPVLTVVSPILSLASGVGYFLGFAPPGVLRRAWQEPELRTFLVHASTLPRQPDMASILRELQRGAAISVGATGATIALWDASTGRLQLHAPDGTPSPWSVPPGETVAGRAFQQRQATYVTDTWRQDPAYRPLYRELNAKAALAAPIIADNVTFGALMVYAPRAPIFADDDLKLLALLADQAAVVLESRTLIEEAAHVRAREVATRLKDDFLSAAAHDFKSPLTTLLTQIEVIQRRAARSPGAPVDLAAIQRVASSAQRMKDLVNELLDATRLERSTLLGEKETVDLSQLVRDCYTAVPAAHHRVQVLATGPVTGRFDRSRMKQLIVNLLENALKYSPEGGDVSVRVWREGGNARIEVADQGIGIPHAELSTVFDRFQRGSNVDDRRFSGMGLGLFICRAIAEEHGGRIWVTSTVGKGSTFQVELPILETEANA